MGSPNQPPFKPEPIRGPVLGAEAIVRPEVLEALRVAYPRITAENEGVAARAARRPLDELSRLVDGR